jgi:Flp pilus assembly protein TadD
MALSLACGVARADAAAEVRALLARADLAGALARAEKAVVEQPRDAQLRFLMGVVLMDMGRDEEALTLFTAMTQDYPELPDPLNNIALLQVRAGRLELARQALETALRNDPGHRTARANLGQVHLMLAVQAWDKAAASGPLDAALLRRLEGARALLAAATPAAR